VLAEYIEVRYGRPFESALEGIFKRQLEAGCLQLPSPFTEDCAVLEIAHRYQMELLRKNRIEITDHDALKQNGFVKESPDFQKIRRHIEAGDLVEGAVLAGVEYVFRPVVNNCEEVAECLVP
jgi:hypothetical protein